MAAGLPVCECAGPTARVSSNEINRRRETALTMW